MKEKTGRFAIIEQFIKDGIKYMFGNPGTTEQGFLDAAESYPEFEYIFTLQESIAVGIADGYARSSKKPTLVQLHSGVGLGNGIGMMYQAMRGHAPLVIIASEAGVKYEAFDSQMAADLVGMAKPVTKWSAKINSTSSLLRMLRRAIKIASTPPMGPVFLALPADVLDGVITEDIIPTSILSTRTMPVDEELRPAASILTGAKNPMFIIGDGIAYSQAEQELAELSEITGAQVWGADCSEANIPADLPQWQGTMGHMFGFHSSSISSKADAVLICGTYVFPDVFPAFDGVFAENAKVIHIDLNDYEIAKNFNVDIGIVSDPKTTLNRLISIIKDTMTQGQKTEAQKRIQHMKTQKDKKLSNEIENDRKNKDKMPMIPGIFMEELSKYIPDNTIIFDEALTSSPDLTRYIPPVKQGSFFQTRGGSLGVGIPGAIGIKLAQPDKTVIGFTGDGGSMYTIQALWTAAHHNIDAKFVICNNHSYKLLKMNILQYWKDINTEAHDFPGEFNINNPGLDFAGLAESMGVPGVRVEKPGEIRPAIDRMLNTKGPFLIDLIITNEI